MVGFKKMKGFDWLLRGEEWLASQSANEDHLIATVSWLDDRALGQTGHSFLALGDVMNRAC